MVKLALLAAPAGAAVASLCATELDFSFAQARDLAGKPMQKVAEAEVRWLFFTICEGALYTADGSTAAWPDMQGPLALELGYHRAVSADALREMTQRHWEEVLTADEWSTVGPAWEAFQAYLPSLAKGDRCAVLYRPGQGITLLHNDTALVTIANDEFARHFLGLYLGDAPLNRSFRDGLLSP